MPRMLCVPRRPASTDLLDRIDGFASSEWRTMPVESPDEIRRVLWRDGAPLRSFAVVIEFGGTWLGAMESIAPPAPALVVSQAGSPTPAWAARHLCGVSALAVDAADSVWKECFDLLARRCESFEHRIRFAQCRARLTQRENELFTHLLQGVSTKQVALALGISVKTAHAHRANILTKFGVDSLEALFAWRFSCVYDCTTCV
jgi:DNA-binding CsgD family transcriptional regulator